MLNLKFISLDKNNKKDEEKDPKFRATFENNMKSALKS